MNYYISDLHFCCASQLAGSGSGYDERDYKTLEEMHTDMLARWNRKVTNGDTVYILGDLSKRGKSEELIALVAQLKGHKILVHGNHMICQITGSGSYLRRFVITKRLQTTFEEMHISWCFVIIQSCSGMVSIEGISCCMGIHTDPRRMCFFRTA